VVGLTKAAAFEYVKKGIRINAVCPATVHTPMFESAPEEIVEMLKTLIPMGRFGKPEEVAGTILYLCSDVAAYQTGSCLVIDGGTSIV
jgi:NAD(P)-dependent dehydrogenase (short-subunit alcohol dehydrogenase family)